MLKKSDYAWTLYLSDGVGPSYPMSRLTTCLSATYERAKEAAPRWDVYELEQQWREWIAKKGMPKNPDAAFVAFCRKNMLGKRAATAKCQRMSNEKYLSLICL